HPRRSDNGTRRAESPAGRPGDRTCRSELPAGPVAAQSPRCSGRVRVRQLSARAQFPDARGLGAVAAIRARVRGPQRRQASPAAAPSPALRRLHVRPVPPSDRSSFGPLCQTQAHRGTDLTLNTRGEYGERMSVVPAWFKRTHTRVTLPDVV